MASLINSIRSITSDQWWFVKLGIFAAILFFVMDNDLNYPNGNPALTPVYIVIFVIIIATVGLADPSDKTNEFNIRNNMKSQLKKEIFENAKIFHLRGGIDYKKLNFVHKTMLKLLYNKVKNLPKDKQTPEDKAMIETYNKKVSFINFSDLDKIIKEINKEQ